MTNSDEFINASKIIKKLCTEPNKDELGKLYGLFKQATIGDINTVKPNMLNYTAREKWNAWNMYNGIDKNEAEIQYINHVNELIQNYGINDSDADTDDN
uniref:ACB domain-containing protein n=1 Tax=viral metagenome TaxID=1070528 RepID=A0A6C0EDH5_9ZZZZ